MLDIIDTIKNYMIYVYPGMISLFISNFVMARNTIIDNNKIFSIITISFIYVFVYSAVTGKEAELFTENDNLVIIVISLLAPVIINYIYRRYRGNIEAILLSMGIDISLGGTVFDRLYRKSTEKVIIKKNMFVRIYSSRLPFRYEGVVESYESDPRNKRVICLTRYRIKKKFKDEYITYKDFSKNCDKFMYINLEDIESMEIEYD